MIQLLWDEGRTFQDDQQEPEVCSQGSQGRSCPEYDYAARTAAGQRACIHRFMFI
ncbi:hypothetical protein [Bacillus sp. FJAT-28004]|uniref:hypothetical protein n=1 Tax=Bacillus sp. FJAT-28004 TaxID=1679165 RepID=UPI001F2BF5E7|nr:hypothetical protein [Bacillus sp. FJAT-28004]